MAGRSLRVTLLALTLSVGGLAAASQSVTCTAAPLAPWLDCFYESPAAHLGPFEVTTGAYLQVDPARGSVIDLAPYLTVAEYRDTYAWWVELRVPKLRGVPVLGINDPIRAGFTYRW